MANQQINQYAIDRIIFGEDDYYDIDYWDGANYQTAKIKGSVLKGGINPGVFVQTADGTAILNTTTETSALGSGVGSLLIPRDSWIVGQSYNFLVTGEIEANLNDTITLRLTSGATQLITGGASTLFQITGAKYFQLEYILTCRTIGVAGVGILEGAGTFSMKVDTSSAYKTFTITETNNTTFDTTIDNTLSITAEWGTADVLNRIMTKTANLTRTF